MKLSKEMEDIILKASMKSDVEIVVYKNEEIIYYIGNSDKCDMYMYSDISSELKMLAESQKETLKIYFGNECANILNGEETKCLNQAIYKGTKSDMLIIFFKLNSEFSDNDEFIINSTTYLLEKFE